MSDIIADLTAAFEQQIETCRLIESRMVDQYVLVDEKNGHMLTTDAGVQPLGEKVNKIQRSRDLPRVRELLAHVKAHNPDNPVAQSLKIMGWKKAARIQRRSAEVTLAHMEELSA